MTQNNHKTKRGHCSTTSCWLVFIFTFLDSCLVCFLSRPVQLRSPFVLNSSARDVNRHLASGGGWVSNGRLSFTIIRGCLAFSSSQKTEKEDADEDEEDEEAGHPTQQGLQGDCVEPSLCLWFGGVRSCHLSKGSWKQTLIPKNWSSAIEQTSLAFLLKEIST